MALEHRFDEEARLTSEQSKRVVDLAARLQAEHDRTVGVDDLAQAAAEAGIETRFIHEAARRVRTEATPPAPETAYETWPLALGLLAMLGFGACYAEPGLRAWLFYGLPWLLHLAAPLALGCALGRRGAPAWFLPLLGGFAFFLGIVLCSTLLAGPYHAYGPASENGPLILTYAIAAWIGTVGGRSLRLLRPFDRDRSRA